MNTTNRTLAAALALLGAGAIVWLLAGPRFAGRAPPSPLAAPLNVEKLEPSVGIPSDEKLEQTLDAVERAEVERYGAAEAARRRERREELLRKRFETQKAAPDGAHEPQ